MKCSHLVSIILFSRSYFEPPIDLKGSVLRPTPEAAKSVQRDSLGRFFRDNYEVVVDCAETEEGNWDQVITVIKQAALDFSRKVGWGEVDKETGLVPFPSSAADGNVLEALNLTLSVFSKHFIDRDLNVTGQNIILLTAGTGLFFVDQILANITEKRFGTFLV